MHDLLLSVFITLLFGGVLLFDFWAMSRMRKRNAVPVLSRHATLALSQDEVMALKAASACPYCGGYHSSACPYIHSIKQTDGTEIVFNKDFADLIENIVYDSDLKEAEAHFVQEALNVSSE